MNKEIRERLEKLEIDVERLGRVLTCTDGEVSKVTILRETPAQPRFKVGDWVQTTNRQVARVICKDGLWRSIVLFVGGDKMSWHNSSLVPWQPREGEWVMGVRCGPYRAGVPFQWRKDDVGNEQCVFPAPLGPQSKEWFK